MTCPEHNNYGAKKPVLGAKKNGKTGDLNSNAI
jgi:hypothetical protein